MIDSVTNASVHEKTANINTTFFNNLDIISKITKKMLNMTCWINGKAA